MRFTARTTVVMLVALLTILPTAALGAKRKPNPRYVVRTLSGQVLGAAIPLGTRTGVPVLLDAASRRRAKLRGPLALIKVPRTALVRAPGNQRVPLANLRPGDAFSAPVRVTAATRRAPYPFFNAGASTFRLTRRGTALSAAELQAQLTALYGYVGSLTGYVLTQFADLRSQMAAMRADLDNLRSALAGLQAQLASLDGVVGAEITKLVERISQLETQLQSVTNQISQITASTTEIQQLLTGVAPGALADALSGLATLQTLVGSVDVNALSSQVSTLADSIGTVGPVDLQTQLSALREEFEKSQSDVLYLCSTAGLVTGDPALGILGLSNLTACP
ncbi:MAG TPA: hypothetical protein VNB64_05610 [Solirubrobacteraceae bacterium]|nr:hypothetical protein [Solirubrobacteraceae bacterium]